MNYPTLRPFMAWILFAYIGVFGAAAAEAGGTAERPEPVIWVLMAVGVVSVILGVLWPLWGLVAWRGRWRWLPLGPLLAMAVIVGRIWFDTRRDPTSHNLWPMEIVMAAIVSVVFMLTLTCVRVLRRTSPPPNPPTSP